MTTTLDQAMKLADQECPLPSLAGPALKVLRDRVRELEAASPAGVPDVRVDKQGVRFGDGCWYSHERITGVSTDQLNEGKCSITAREYMKWVQSRLAAAPSAKPEEALGAAKAQFPAQYFVHAPIGPVGCCEKHMVALLGIYNFLGAHVAVTYAATGSTCVNCETEAAAETGECASGEA